MIRDLPNTTIEVIEHGDVEELVELGQQGDEWLTTWPAASRRGPSVTRTN